MKPTLILRDWTLSLSVDDVLVAQGADPAVLRARRPRLVAAAERALTEGAALLEPAVAWSRFAVGRFAHETLVLEGGGRLSGPAVANRLAPAEHVIVSIQTVGHALDERVAELMSPDPVYALALDGLGTAAVDELGRQMRRRLEVEAREEGREAGLPLSPGAIGWPLDEGQAQLFALVDGEAIGVTVAPSGQMTPRKTTSRVVGLGHEMLTEGKPCDFCSMKEGCRYQGRHHG
jgi:hypothetical protein